MIKKNINTKYGEVPVEYLKNYLQKTIDKIFKILPLKEKKSETLHTYLKSLQIELIGNNELINELKNEPNFLSILGTIEYFINNDENVDVYKREVFKLIDIIEKIKKRIEGSVDN